MCEEERWSVCVCVLCVRESVRVCVEILVSSDSSSSFSLSRVQWLENLAVYHISHKNYVEAALCKVRVWACVCVCMCVCVCACLCMCEITPPPDPSR